jgi:prepilin-type N-terminal cleavage/methylation domain-containing protein
MHAASAVPEGGKAVRKQGSSQAGFSLTELLVAMAVTLVIGGTILGLMISGSNAFRREPDRAARQQNVRASLDLVLRDVAVAGEGMPDFVQVFTPNLDGPAGAPAGPDPATAGTPNGGVTDELEMLANTGDFDPEDVCDYNGGAATLFMKSATTRVQAPMVVLVTFPGGLWTLSNITTVTPRGAGGPNAGCSAGTHAHLIANPGLDPTGYNTPGGLCGGVGTANGLTPCAPSQIALAEQVRWRIRVGADGVPNLERFNSSDATTGFKVVSRGIEDLQVEYGTAGDPPGVWRNTPPAMALNAYASLVTRVRVTLSARGEIGRLAGQAGQPANAGAARFLRSRLTSTMAPRAALRVAARNPSPSPHPWN